MQTAGSLSSEGNVITLHGLSPSTIYYADSSHREVGHMSTRRFVGLWGEGDNSFEVDSPNGVLSFAEPGDRTPEEVVVTVRDPILDGDSMRYEVTVLDGTLPASTGLVHCSSSPSADRFHLCRQPECIVATAVACVAEKPGVGRRN